MSLRLMESYVWHGYVELLLKSFKACYCLFIILRIPECPEEYQHFYNYSTEGHYSAPFLFQIGYIKLLGFQFMNQMFCSNGVLKDTSELAYKVIIWHEV